VPWTAIKGVRIQRTRDWGRYDPMPGGHSYYMVQVLLAGQWRRVGQVQPVRNAILPRDLREALFGEEGAMPMSEKILRQGYELIRSRWERGGGKDGPEDDNWPPT
jgi:hypothetical protein